MSAGADWSRTCEGCEHVKSEPWAKGKTAFRCFAPGPCRGYHIGTERFLPYIPAWCPKMERKKEVVSVRHLGDITKLNGYELPAVDVVIGGSPC